MIQVMNKIFKLLVLPLFLLFFSDSIIPQPIKFINKSSSDSVAIKWVEESSPWAVAMRFFHNDKVVKEIIFDQKVKKIKGQKCNITTGGYVSKNKNRAILFRRHELPDSIFSLVTMYDEKANKLFEISTKYILDVTFSANGDIVALLIFDKPMYYLCKDLLVYSEKGVLLYNIQEIEKRYSISNFYTRYTFSQDDNYLFVFKNNGDTVKYFLKESQ